MGRPRKDKRPGRQPELPGDEQAGRSMEQHPLFDEMYDMLRHGFGPDTIVRMLEARYAPQIKAEEMKPLPSSRTVRRWREHHLPPRDLLPGSLIDKKLKGMDVKIDLFHSLQNTYRLLEDRIARAAEGEEMLALPLPETDKAAKAKAAKVKLPVLPMFLPNMDKAVETLVRVAEILWRVGQDLGMYPRAAASEALNAAFLASGAQAISNVFIIDGERKTVEMMTDKELVMVEQALLQAGAE